MWVEKYETYPGRLWIYVDGRLVCAFSDQACPDGKTMRDMASQIFRLFHGQL